MNDELTPAEIERARERIKRWPREEREALVRMTEREARAIMLLTAELDITPVQEPLFEMPPHLGSRGGTTGSYEEGASRVHSHKPEEVWDVRRAILRHAHAHGEVHADDVADVPVSERNIVGIAFRTLRESGMIVSTGEHRASKLQAAHGRKSYVYRLTEKGHGVP